ncbi:hypothetical protein HK099_006593 [Clydaea vesicula]|uniref:Uncharacterized protein n=1 Tax=Clydaea vesicula TaxID=447962 RepID=A0AAD5U5Y0_9FUNG|nr:hypothetical protein HK099_006593 [Clydaea vesicula]
MKLVDDNFDIIKFENKKMVEDEIVPNDCTKNVNEQIVPSKCKNEDEFFKKYNKGKKWSHIFNSQILWHWLHDIIELQTILFSIKDMARISPTITLFLLGLSVVLLFLAITQPLVSIAGYYDLHLFPDNDRFDCKVSDTHQAS